MSPIALRWSRLFLAVLSLAVFSQVTSVATAQPEETETRLFEMRIYTCHEGKLDELNARFKNHTNALFVKHGMELIGYWVPTEGAEAENTLVYILAYPSKEARQKAWDGFLNDPAWKRAYAESTRDGKLVKKVESKFMSPTDYSPIK